jgi:uncharacterized membrane protein
MTEKTTMTKTKSAGDRGGQVSGAGSRTRGLRVVLGMVLAAVVAGASLAAEAPTRVMAPFSATLNHEPFPLVTADALGAVRVSLSEVVGGTARFFTFMVGDKAVEMFVVWTDDNVIRTAFNACDVCYRAKLGYRQDGDVVICQNCGNRFATKKIGAVSGGCNPAPFVASVEGEELVFSAADLAAGLKYFP